MPKHYRPAGKKKEGNAAKYLTRSQSIKYLQLSLPVFRKLCILKAVYPRVPKKKVKGNHHAYYHTKDILFLKCEPLLETLRDMRAYDKKVTKAISKKNRDLAERLLTRAPSYTLDMLVKERYPKRVDALRDLDDCLSMVHLFSALPALDKAVYGDKIPVARVHNCRRLSHEWQAYISRTHRLRKVFISVKGIYYQVEVDGQQITWLSPHATQQVLPEIDYRVLLTFLEFYETVLAFVNFDLYESINMKYPPILDPRQEAHAADLYALSRLFDAYNQVSSLKPKSEDSSASEVTHTEGAKHDESELQFSQLQQLSSNEPGTLMRLVAHDTQLDEEDEETKECKNLFRNMTFFLSREVPRDSLLFLIPAFGGAVSWEGEGSPLQESDQSITHQVVDRPTQDHKFLSRDYMQPQWVYDCVNARIILPTDKYAIGCVAPPHLSPFVDNDAEGHIPEYAEIIARLKAAERKEVLPLPGTETEDLEDPHRLLDVIDRAEAIEAAERKRKLSMLEKQYHSELKQELNGSTYSAHRGDGEEEQAVEEDIVSSLDQIAKDTANMSKVVMSRRKRGVLEAIEMGKQKKHAETQRLKKRKKQLDEAKKIG